MFYCNRDTAATTVVEQRNLDTAATEFQRRFHISADDEGRHRNSVVNQVSLTMIFITTLSCHFYTA